MTLDSSGFYVWPKGERTRLSTHFETWEFECPCKQCDEQRISSFLVNRLKTIRQNMGALIVITSGYRCANYQEDLRRRGYETAVGISQHQLGNAVDIKPGRASQMSELLRQCEGHFKAIGVGKTFLHVDMRADKVRRWTYGK